MHHTSADADRWLDTWRFFDRTEQLWSSKRKSQLEKSRKENPSVVFYDAKLAKYTVDKQDDPLSESILEKAVTAFHADLAAGCGFPDDHPVAVAARAGSLHTAEMVRSGWSHSLAALALG